MFYEKVKGLCDKKGISVTELTTTLKLGTSAATGWKKGSLPRASTIKAIADYFGVDNSYFNEKGNIAVNSSNVVQGNQNTVTFNNGEKHTFVISEIESEIIRLCQKMTIQEKNELLTTAYKLVNKE